MKLKQRSIDVHLEITCSQQLTESLLGALQDLQRLSREEPGNRVFDILRSCDDSGSYLLTEECEDEAAVAAHRASSHFRIFKEVTASLGLTIKRCIPI